MPTAEGTRCVCVCDWLILIQSVDCRGKKVLVFLSRFFDIFQPSSTIFELFCLQNSLIVGMQPQVCGKVGSLVGFWVDHGSAFPMNVEFYRKASCRGRNKNSATKATRRKRPDFIRLTLDIYISKRNGWLPCGRLP